MITDPFDTGLTGTFRALCQKYPDDTVYNGADGFRSLWGPIFHGPPVLDAQQGFLGGNVPHSGHRTSQHLHRGSIRLTQSAWSRCPATRRTFLERWRR